MIESYSGDGGKIRFIRALSKQHMLLLSIIVWSSVCQMSPALADGQGCQKEELGLWTKVLPFNPGTKISIQSSLQSWKIVVELYQMNVLKAKIIFHPSADSIIVTGFGIKFSVTKLPLDLIRSGNKLTLNFTQKRGTQLMMNVGNDSGEEHNLEVTGFKITEVDSIRIFSDGNFDKFPKTVVNVCNPNDNRSNQDESTGAKAESCPVVTPCPQPAPPPTPKPCPNPIPCPPVITWTTREPCPTPIPCPTQETTPCPEATSTEKVPCPELSCPTTTPCPSVVCPSPQPCPTLTTIPLPEACPTLPTPPPPPPPCPTLPTPPPPPPPCPSTLSPLESQLGQNESHDPFVNRTLHRDQQPPQKVPGWVTGLMYGLICGCVLLSIISIVLAVLLCKARQQQQPQPNLGEHPETVYFTNPSPTTGWNNAIGSQQSNSPSCHIMSETQPQCPPNFYEKFNSNKTSGIHINSFVTNGCTEDVESNGSSEWDTPEVTEAVYENMQDMHL